VYLYGAKNQGHDAPYLRYKYKYKYQIEQVWWFVSRSKTYRMTLE